MATTDLIMNDNWIAAHTATVGNTNVVLTPHGKDIDWAINTSTPADSLVGHNLAQTDMLIDNYRDRGFVLKSQEVLYVRGSTGLVVSMTVATP